MARATSRRSIVLSGGAAAGLLLAACGQGAGQGESGTGAAKKPATVQYWARYAGAIGEVEEKSIPVFKGKFPHITVEKTVITGSYDGIDKLSGDRPVRLGDVNRARS